MIDIRLLKPLQAAQAGPLVQVGLDGVLFSTIFPSTGRTASIRGAR